MKTNRIDFSFCRRELFGKVTSFPVEIRIVGITEMRRGVIITAVDNNLVVGEEVAEESGSVKLRTIAFAGNNQTENNMLYTSTRGL